MKTIDKSSLNFLTDLNLNNNREWFNERKPFYIDAQKNFIDFVDDIIQGVAEYDESVEKLEAKSCVFRIYKDTRFSKDKTPYKTNMGASLTNKGSKTLSHAGYYIHLEPGKSFVGGGVYMTESKNLKAIRQKISDNGHNFLEIIEKKSFRAILELQGDRLVKVPQGFDKEDPMADYLKYKQFTAFRYLTDQEMLSKNAVEIIVNTFKELHPLNLFLNEAIDDIS